MEIHLSDAFDLTSFRNIWKSDELESDIDKVSNMLSESPLLLETLQLRRASLAIIDLRQMRYLCSFGDAEDVCGWPKAHLLRDGVGYFLSKLVPADCKGLEKMSELVSQYVVKIGDDKIKHFKAFFDFQMTRPDGSVRRIMQEGVALQRDPSGNITFLLALISDVSHMKREGRQHLRLTDGSENLIYEYDTVNGACRQIERLTKRELEIARLIGRKLSSEAIAKQLFISQNTVNTHRQNMLRKFDMSDIMELLNFLSVYQLV